MRVMWQHKIIVPGRGEGIRGVYIIQILLTLFWNLKIGLQRNYYSNKESEVDISANLIWKCHWKKKRQPIYRLRQEINFSQEFWVNLSQMSPIYRTLLNISFYRVPSKKVNVFIHTKQSLFFISWKMRKNVIISIHKQVFQSYSKLLWFIFKDCILLSRFILFRVPFYLAVSIELRAYSVAINWLFTQTIETTI